ncbi:MAG: hypothetical protein AAGC93_18415 [Cyanobacteria bacterium P01_F01_bin.53]
MVLNARTNEIKAPIFAVIRLLLVLPLALGCASFALLFEKAMAFRQQGFKAIQENPMEFYVVLALGAFMLQWVYIFFKAIM